MAENRDFRAVVEEICIKDPRYKADAYEFVLQALHYTQNQLKKQTHLTGGELLEGVKLFSIEQFGAMAKTVLNHWGITNTLDLGNIVFNMIANKLLSKTEEDSIEDFKDVYNFDLVFGNVLRDTLTKDLK